MRLEDDLMPSFNEVAEMVGVLFDGVGVAVIVLGTVVATVRLAAYRRHDTDPYRQFRQDIGAGNQAEVELVAAQLRAR